MVDLPGPCRATALALLDAGLAWQTAGELAAATGLDPDATADALARLDLEGWISVWDRPEAPAVTFTPLGAERLGIRLVESGPDQVPRWSRLGDPEPPAPPAKNVARSAGSAWLAGLIDPRPAPDRLAELAEEAAARRVEADPSAGGARDRVGVDHLPRPTVLIGLGHTPWPGPAVRPCPVCSGRPLAPPMYCLNCDRWGLDSRLGPRPAPPGRPTPRLADPSRLARDAAEARRRRKQARTARRASGRKPG